MESKLDEVTSLIENDIEIVVKRGKRAFDSIATEIQNKVQSSIPEIKEKILDAGKDFFQTGRCLGVVSENLTLILPKRELCGGLFIVNHPVFWRNR